jgi:hypothetical protein
MFRLFVGEGEAMRDTIDMAREAGFNVKLFKPPVITAQHSNGSWVSVGDELKAFEALVRADQCEIDAKIADDLTKHSFLGSVGDAIRARRQA